MQPVFSFLFFFFFFLFFLNSYVDTKAFSSKQLLAKFTPLEEATQAVTGVVVLSPSRKEDVPAGYRRLPYVYSKHSTCYN